MFQWFCFAGTELEQLEQDLEQTLLNKKLDWNGTGTELEREEVAPNRINGLRKGWNPEAKLSADRFVWIWTDRGSVSYLDLVREWFGIPSEVGNFPG